MLDRLERPGYAPRVRDAADCRRVLVELTPEAQRHANRFYAPHRDLAERLYRRHTEEQLELLLEFTRRGQGFNGQPAAIGEDRNRPKRVP